MKQILRGVNHFWQIFTTRGIAIILHFIQIMQGQGEKLSPNLFCIVNRQIMEKLHRAFTQISKL